VTRNIDSNYSREREQAPEEDASGSQGSSESLFLRGKMHLPLSGSTPNQNALGKRECEVLRLLAEGKSNKEIASLLSLSIKTVETYRSRIMLKLGIHSLAHLVRYAVQNKLVIF
jgi:DNA-binding NarL/FixJ family response regulator